MSNCILVTHWTGGDVYPFIRLGKLLWKEGHRVTVVTHCIYENAVLEAGLFFEPVDTLKEYENINRDMHMLADPIGNRADYVNFHLFYHGRERLLREVKIIENLCNSDTVIIARYRSSISGMLAAEKHGLRYASLILAPNYFSHMELHNELFGKAFCEEINSARTELGLPLINDWREWLFSPSCILCGWPEWFAQPDETWPDSACPIGYIRETDEKEDLFSSESLSEAEKLIEKAACDKKRVAVITGGSSRMVRRDFYDIAIKACIEAGVYAFVVTPYDEYIPENLPDSVKHIKNISLRKLMEKTDIVIHHGGMGTINEATDAAKPQIIMPHLTDGPDNADRMAKLGTAKKFPPKMWSVSSVAAAITEMLAEEKKDLCEYYRKLNREIYTEKLWNAAIEKLTPYVLPKQKEIVLKETKGTTRGTVSREALLELLRRKRENK